MEFSDNEGEVGAGGERLEKITFRRLGELTLTEVSINRESQANV